MLHLDQDEAAIRQAAVLYAIGADRRDKALWTQVLTDGCVIEGPGFRIEGLEANLASLDRLAQLFIRTQHRVHDQLMEITNDRAVGETYCTVDHLREIDGQTELLCWSLRYQDELIRDEGSWRFISRRLLIDWEEVRPIIGSTTITDSNRKIYDDRTTVIQTVYDYAKGIDTRDWELFRSIFMDEVAMDFQSWDSIAPYIISADKLIENVRVYFAGLDATQHIMTNPQVQVNGDRARCVVYMQAEHFLDDQSPSRRFVIGGYYTNELVQTPAGWRLCSVQLTVLWASGDRSFMEDAPLRGMTRLGVS